jgi:hypothetical protein
MLPLPDERVLYKSPNGRLQVTTHRVRYDRQDLGTEAITSIMLEQVASCALSRRTYPSLFVLAWLCVLAGFLVGIQSGCGAVAVGAAFGWVCGLAYLFSRQYVVVIASAGSSITLNVRDWTIEDVRELFDHIETAKNVRCLALVGAADPGAAYP